MPREYFIDTDRELFVAGDTDTTPLTGRALTAGDKPATKVYFLRRTGIIGQPYVYVSKAGSTVKLSLGRAINQATQGAWTATWTDTTSSLAYNITPAALETALNALAAITSAGGVTVSGSMKLGFQVRWNNVGARALFTVDTGTLAPSQYARIRRRVTGDGSTREIQDISFRPMPCARQDTWADLSTTLTVTPSEVQAGSSTANEVQKVSFSQRAASGGLALTLPADSVAVSSIAAGVVTCGANHGLVENQPISFSSSSGASGYTDGTIYYVLAVTSLTKFTFAATPGGAAITGASASSSTLGTIAEQTVQLGFLATAGDWQTALEALTSIGVGNVSVTGIEREEFTIAFLGRKGLRNLPLMTAASTLAGAPGKSADFDLNTVQSADLLAGEIQAAAVLECEVTTGGEIDTTARADVTLAEEQIGGDTPDPVDFDDYPAIGTLLTTACLATATITIGTESVAVDITSAGLVSAPTHCLATIQLPNGSADALLIKGVVIDSATQITVYFAAAATASGYKVTVLFK